MKQNIIRLLSAITLLLLFGLTLIFSGVLSPPLEPEPPIVQVEPASEPQAPLVSEPTVTPSATVKPSPTYMKELGQPTFTPSLTPPPVTPTVEAQRPPTCQFNPSAEPPEEGIPLENYHFGEPQVVLTHSRSIYLADWLPDSKRLLLVRDIPNSDRAKIDILDTERGGLLNYAESVRGSPQVAWLPTRKGVVYTTRRDNQGVELRLSNQEGEDELIASLVHPFAWDVAPSFPQLLYHIRGQLTVPIIFEADTRQHTHLSLDLAQWKYSLETRTSQEGPSAFHPVWRPNSSQVVFYQGSWLFLADLESHSLCELSLESDPFFPRMVWKATWSPNGRFLALLTSAYLPPELMPIDQLVIWDLVTGQLHKPSFPLSHLFDLSWSSDSQSLAFLGVVDQVDGFLSAGLFLLRIPELEFQRVLLGYQFGPPESLHSLSWAPDGNTLALQCVTLLESEEVIPINQDRVCLISVSKSADGGE